MNLPPHARGPALYRWRCHLGNVVAPTKSEARAVLKRLTGGPLPKGLQLMRSPKPVAA